MEKTCNSCDRLFASWNPFRKLCERCQQSRRGDEIVLLEIATTELQGLIWKDMLENAGIPCMLQDSRHGIAHYSRAEMALGGELRVFRRDLEQARAVIEVDDLDLPADAGSSSLRP